MMAFQVSRRINEMGVRLALGAARRDIVALVLAEVGAILVVGAIVAGGCPRAMSGLAARMLFGATPADHGVFALRLRPWASRLLSRAGCRHAVLQASIP